MALGDRNGDPFAGVQLGFLGVDLHHDHAFGADARGNAEDQADVFQDDVVHLAAVSDCRAGDPRHALAHLDEGGLVVERHDLGAAENVDSRGCLQRADQDADALARGRQHQPTVAQVAVDPPERKVRDRLPAQPGRRRHRFVGAAVAEVLVVEEKAGHIGCRLDDVSGDRHHACYGVLLDGLPRGEEVAQQAPVEQQRVLQAQFDAEFFLVVQHHFGDEHLDHHLRRLGVQLFDQLLNFFVEARGCADDQGVADRLGHHHHFALDLLEGADRAGRRLLHLALGPQEIVDRRGHVKGRGVLQSIHGVHPLRRLLGVQSQEQGFDDGQVARRPGGDDRVGPRLDGEADGHQRRFPLGSGKLRPQARRGRSRQQAAEHQRQRVGVAVDDAEYLDLGNRRRRVELLDQGGNQLQAVGRAGNQQRVGMRVGYDLHLVEDPGPQQALPVGVDGQQLQRGRLVAGPEAPGRVDRPLKRVSQVCGQRVVELEDARPRDRRALVGVEPAHEQLHLFEVARRALHEDRIGPQVGGHLDFRPQTAPAAEKLLKCCADLRRRGVPQPKDAALGGRIHRPIQLLDQLLDRANRFPPADQQQGVRLNQRRDGHPALPAAHELLLDFADQADELFTADVLERVDFDHRLGQGTEPFDLFDQPAHLLDVALAPAHNDHVQVGERLDLDVDAHVLKTFLAGPRGTLRSGRTADLAAKLADLKQIGDLLDASVRELSALIERLRPARAIGRASGQDSRGRRRHAHLVPAVAIAIGFVRLANFDRVGVPKRNDPHAPAR